MVASLPMPRGLGRLDQEEQLFVGSLSPAGSAKRIETRDHCGRPQAPGHCLSHLARRNLLQRDRKGTRLNSSHSQISYAVFCLKKKKRRTWTVLSSWRKARDRSATVTRPDN